jgi:hypothetical protein
MERITLRHVSHGNAVTRTRAAAAGVAGTIVWAAIEPLDKRLFRHDYSDVALLGKAVTRSRAWPLAGLAVHAANGAAFGLAYSEVRERRKVGALQLALAEHVALFPIGWVADRVHPARGEPGLEKLFSLRAFGQATLRHAVFGAVLARLTREEAE